MDMICVPPWMILSQAPRPLPASCRSVVPVPGRGAVTQLGHDIYSELLGSWPPQPLSLESPKSDAARIPWGFAMNLPSEGDDLSRTVSTKLLGRMAESGRGVN